jgi:[ribosomal protein S5]-alanine N-acetyltransferase
MEFPQRVSPRLLLTPITMNDLDAVFQLFSHPDVVKYYDLEPFTSSLQAEKLIALFESRFKESAGIRWGIHSKSGGGLIGTCGFNSWSEKMHSATIGYDLSPDYWNQGLVTEALAEILKVAFDGVLPCAPLHRIQADTIPGNIASEKVLRKLGFKEEGVRREAMFARGQYHDLKCFGLLKSEFNVRLALDCHNV